MKTFLINLDESVDRLAYMDGLLRGFGIVYERISGVLGRALTEDERKHSFSPVRSYIAQRGHRMTDAEIGCALSHISIYRRMVSESIPIALVFEDDIRIEEKGIFTAIDAVQKFADPARPQVILLSKPQNKRLSCGSGIIPVKSMSQTCAYCITLEAAKLILRVNFPVVTVADFFRRWRKLFGLELFRYAPPVADQGAGFNSMIGERKQGCAWFFKFFFGLLDRVITLISGR